jgi:release factor glutamine methyltransferase
MTQAAGTEQSWTVGGLLEWTIKFLNEKGCEFPRLDAQVLLAHVLGCKRIDLYGQRYTEPADEDVRRRYRELIRKRIEGCPVAYLVGRKEFYKLDFEVTRDVLIPRPDSEMVVMTYLEVAKSLPSPRIIDLGTGSGNLAVAVAHQHKGARVVATDISPAALVVAARNAAKHGVAERIQFVCGDLFAPVPVGERFDFVLSNPPYIPRDEIPKLEPGVRDYEPHRALDGGPDGYEVLERLAAQTLDFLTPGGYLIIEIGAPQEQEARRRIAAYAGYELAPTIHDYSGHPRVLKARRT